jgi:K+-transporting ATPase KdpF subunit
LSVVCDDVSDLGTQIGLRLLKIYHYDHNYSIPHPADFLLGILQIHRLVRKNLKDMIALFIIAVAVFLYMVYVLIKPEKF